MLYCQDVKAQELRKKVEKIVIEIAEENVYCSSAVGFAGEETKQWKRFERLQRDANDMELKYLTSHKNPVVRCYAFQALADRNNSEIFEILIDHLNDDENVSTFIGCIVSSQLVGDFFLNAVNPKYIPETEYELNERNQRILDSLVLFETDAKLLARSWLLQDVEPKPAYYEKLKEVYVKEKDPYSLIALARYKKEEDQELITSWLENDETNKQSIGLKAISNWPDAFFYPFVEMIHEQEINKSTGFNYSLIRELYMVLVQYKNAKSRDLILKTLSNTEGATLEYHKQYIWLALTKHPDASYQGIIEKIDISDWKKEMFKDELSEGEN